MRVSRLLKDEIAKFCFNVLKNQLPTKYSWLKLVSLGCCAELFLMATFPEFTNQGIPSDGNLGPFPPFGNVGAPYMATLSLPGLTVGFPVGYF